MHTDIPLHSPPRHFVTFPPRLLILLTSKSKSFSLHSGKLSSSYLQICVSYPAGAPQRLSTHLDPSSLEGRWFDEKAPLFLEHDLWCLFIVLLVQQ